MCICVAHTLYPVLPDLADIRCLVGPGSADIPRAIVSLRSLLFCLMIFLYLSYGFFVRINLKDTIRVILNDY